MGAAESGGGPAARAGGRPRLLSPDDEDFVVQTATTRPTKLGQPFTRWSIRKLLAYLRKDERAQSWDRGDDPAGRGGVRACP